MNEEEWKTVYDVQIYVTSLSAISDCNWNKLESVSYTHLTLPTNREV